MSFGPSRSTVELMQRCSFCGVRVDVAVLHVERYRRPGEPRPGIEDLVHGHLAGEALDQADHARTVVRPGVLDDAAFVDRHEIRDHHDSSAGGEHGVEEVGPVPISLMDLVGLVGMDLPAAALPRVEDPAEERVVVEARQAEPVDAAVHPHQRRRAAVADQAIGPDRQIPVDPLVRDRTTPGLCVASTRPRVASHRHRRYRVPAARPRRPTRTCSSRARRDRPRSRRPRAAR